MNDIQYVRGMCVCVRAWLAACVKSVRTTFTVKYFTHTEQEKKKEEYDYGMAEATMSDELHYSYL